MQDYKMLFLGLVLGFLLTIMFGFALGNNDGRYQPIVMSKPLALMMVDTATGETKVVMGSGVSSQFGKTFNDMVPFPGK